MGVRSKPAPVVQYGQSSGAGSAGVHNVVAGDTLYSISNRYRLAMRDIAVINRLQPPFVLHEGERLRLPPPQEYTVRPGDSISSVSRLFGVNSSEISKMNNISSPYVIHPGQVLRLPSVTRKTQQTAKTQNKKVATKAYSPSNTAEASQVKDGVPIPQGKPGSYGKSKPVEISKVRTKAPKRSSSKFLKPVDGKIISNYGAKKSGLHNDGINIRAARGAPVKAAENGVVVYSGNALKGSGNLVLLRHDNQWMTAYGHLDSMSVKKGAVVKRGETIGKVGSTGSVAVPQLHFEIRRGTSAMNPTKYMD